MLPCSAHVTRCSLGVSLWGQTFCPYWHRQGVAERRMVYCQQILKHGQLCDVLPKALRSGDCAVVAHCCTLYLHLGHHLGLWRLWIWIRCVYCLVVSEIHSLNGCLWIREIWNYSSLCLTTTGGPLSGFWKGPRTPYWNPTTIYTSVGWLWWRMSLEAFNSLYHDVD